MHQLITPIEHPLHGQLARTTADEYCRAAARMQHNEFWWYYNGLSRFRGRWKPFQDRAGRWWYFVKPGFAWPVDYFTPIQDPAQDFPPKLVMGWQCPVGAPQANSKVWLNVIHDLEGYDLSRVAANKRRAVRKGLRELDIEIANPANDECAREAAEVWNSHVVRTGWNTEMDPARFVKTWRELAHWPGTTVMTARDAKTGSLCAWLIARVIDDTVFIDTIASHTDRLASRPNDAIIFQCLTNAAQLGVRHAHYSLMSKLESLECFKQSLGFVAHPFVSRLKLSGPVGPVLRMVRPSIYKRLQGDPVWSEKPQRPAAAGLLSRVFARAAAESPAAAQAYTRPLLPDVNRWKRDDVEDIVESWFVPPTPATKSGWLVYSLDFVLAAMQGTMTEPQNIRHTPAWRFAGRVVLAAMAMMQLGIMILSRLPVACWFVEMLARTFTRNAAGFFLRSCYWKARLGSLGADTLIDQGVEIWGPANVSIGSNCHVDTNVRLAAGERRHRQRGAICIGNYVHLGPGVHIAGRGTVLIHDSVGISAQTHIYSATNTIELPADPGQLVSMSHMAPPDQQHVVEAPIVIEPYAFVGMMSRVLPGVRIGYGAVIHAASEVTRDVPPFANISGPPRGRQIGWRMPRRRSAKLPKAPSPKRRAQKPRSATSV